MQFFRYDFFHDAGHGWLQVPLDHLSKVQFKPSKYSYKDELFAYLEEDCDAPRYTETLKAELNIDIESGCEIYMGSYWRALRGYTRFD